MGAGYWLLRPWRHAFDFSGRSPRREYWLFVAQQLVLIAVLVLVLSALRDGGPATRDRLPGNVFGTVTALACLAAFVAGLAVAVRRLHDQDKSALMLLLWFVPAGGLFLLVFMLLEGTDGANIYGEDPRLEPSLAGMSEVFE